MGHWTRSVLEKNVGYSRQNLTQKMIHVIPIRTNTAKYFLEFNETIVLVQIVDLSLKSTKSFINVTGKSRFFNILDVGTEYAAISF